MHSKLPHIITDEKELEAVLGMPYPALVKMMKNLDGDLIILGAGGKMGPSLARLALTATKRAGVNKRIIAVSRFSDEETRQSLEQDGIETIACDLNDPETIKELPDAKNIVFMAGRKFGERGSEPDLWVTNTIIPGYIARRYKNSRIIVFSTGCVYPMVPVKSKGCVETDAPNPIGEYGASCLGRERIFEYFSRTCSTPMVLFRLNYAIELRYGVLVDIAQRVLAGNPVDITVNAVNVIWEGDANNRALLCLEHATSPPFILNITGKKILSIENIARNFARLFDKPLTFTGTQSGVAYLSDARKSIELFGMPRVPVHTAIYWVAEWLKQRGRTFGKPTHFEVVDGDFLT